MHGETWITGAVRTLFDAGAIILTSPGSAAEVILRHMDAYTTHTRRRPRRLRRVSVPERVGSHVKLLFTEMRRQNVTYDEVEAGSGVRKAAIKAWRHKNSPSLDSIEAALGFMGYDFVPVPRAKVLPPELVAELRDVAARMNSTVPDTIRALVEIVTGIHARFGERPSAEGAGA